MIPDLAYTSKSLYASNQVGSRPIYILYLALEHDYSRYLNLSIIMQRMPALGTHLSSSTTAITLVPLTKKTSILALSQNQQKLATKLRELIIVYRKNLQHAQKLQKQYHNKYAKPRNYIPGEKVWLNSKYIKTKQNRKL